MSSNEDATRDQQAADAAEESFQVKIRRLSNALGEPELGEMLAKAADDFEASGRRQEELLRQFHDSNQQPLVIIHDDTAHAAIPVPDSRFWRFMFRLRYGFLRRIGY